MNYLCFAVCLVAFVVIVDAYPGFSRCETSDDCGEKHCCVRLGGPWYKMTKCKAHRKEGKECIPQKSKNGLYDFKCPCEEGLECVGEKKVKPTSGGSSSSSSSSSESAELEYRCRSTATSGPPEDHSEEPHPASEEPEVEEENVEVPEPVV